MKISERHLMEGGEWGGGGRGRTMWKPFDELCLGGESFETKVTCG